MPAQGVAATFAPVTSSEVCHVVTPVLSVMAMTAAKAEVESVPVVRISVRSVVRVIAGVSVVRISVGAVIVVDVHIFRLRVPDVCSIAWNPIGLVGWNRFDLSDELLALGRLLIAGFALLKIQRCDLVAFLVGRGLLGYGAKAFHVLLCLVGDRRLVGLVVVPCCQLTGQMLNEFVFGQFNCRFVQGGDSFVHRAFLGLVECDDAPCQRVIAVKLSESFGLVRCDPCQTELD